MLAREDGGSPGIRLTVVAEESRVPGRNRYTACFLAQPSVRLEHGLLTHAPLPFPLRFPFPGALERPMSRLTPSLVFLSAGLLLAVTGALPSAGAPGAGIRAQRLRCEYLANPLGLDERVPRLSWQLGGATRGERQTAYQLLAASDAKLLQAGKADLWDSGRVTSDQSQHVVYAGRPLGSAQRVHWRVRVWDRSGAPSAFSETAWFETGLDAGDWKAAWIGYPGNGPAAKVASLDGAKWVWFPEGNPVQSAAAGKRYFRKTLSLDRKPKRATFWMAVDNDAQLWANGAQAGSANGWPSAQPSDILDKLVGGANTFAVVANNATEGPAALMGRLVIEFESGPELVQDIDASWKASSRDMVGWEKPGFNDASWPATKVLGALGIAPWGKVAIGSHGNAGPSPHLRKQFQLTRGIRSARAYVSALGLYELHLNGKRIGDEVLAPGWTDYTKRVQYQTYDVTSDLRRGANVVGAVLADGWYAGSLGPDLARNHFGPSPARLKLQIQVRYEDGGAETITTDRSWLGSNGPILESDLYAGETYDARRELPEWTNPDLVQPTNVWQAVQLFADQNPQLSGLTSPPIRVTREIAPVAVREPKPGVFVFDMGENMVGWARLRAKGPAGTSIKLRFAEILNPDGSVYRDNLRKARATDVYVLKGAGNGKTVEEWEPSFTYHGFRYVEITGYPGEPKLDALAGRVIHSAMPRTSRLETSSDLVNKLFENIHRGQRGNMMSVPTDCPQRDERLGWMGDAQLFARTANWNMEMGGFWTKWMRDILDAQSPEGAFGDIAPRVVNKADGAPSWGDAGVVIPWEQYLAYGDTRLLERSYPAVKKYVDLLVSANPDLLWLKRRNNDFGDWVPAGEQTNKDLIASGYLAWDLRAVSEMARVLGKKDEAARYGELADKAKAAYNARFLDAEGRYTGDTQTAYAMSFGLGLVPDARRAQVTQRFTEALKRRNDHLATGFIGTRFLLPALSDTGQSDLAYRVLLQRDFPSWGYMVEKGATSIWELWDSDKQGPDMNSRNHFAFGTVGEWLQRYLVGIDTDPIGYGYRRVRIQPQVGPGITWARGAYDSGYGTIESGWKLEGETLSLDVRLPVGSTGVVRIPKRGLTQVRISEGGREVWREGFTGVAPGLLGARDLGDAIAVECESGNFNFRLTGVRSK